MLVTRLFFNLVQEWAEGLTSPSNSRSALLPLTRRQFPPIKETGTAVVQYHSGVTVVQSSHTETEK